MKKFKFNINSDKSQSKNSTAYHTIEYRKLEWQKSAKYLGMMFNISFPATVNLVDTIESQVRRRTILVDKMADRPKTKLRTTMRYYPTYPSKV